MFGGSLESPPMGQASGAGDPTAADVGVAITGNVETTSPSSTALKPSSTTSIPSTAVATVATGECDAATAVAQLPLEMRSGQVVMVGVGSDEVSLAKELLGTLHLGGVLVREANSANLSANLASMAAASTIRPFIGVDEEGGRVQRLKGLFGRLPSARDAAASMSPSQLRDLMAVHGEKMRSLGFNLVFAPVVDLDSGPANGAIGDRSYSADPHVAAQYATAFAQGVYSSGVLPVLKHFPGLGTVGADTHDGLGVTAPIEQLRQNDLLAFEDVWKILKVPVMVGHVSIPGLSEPTPASLSPNTISGLLRGELGFDGVVFSDSLSMGAITASYGPAQASALSIAAGADVALIASSGSTSATARGVVDTIVAWVKEGKISEAALNRSVERLLRIKGVNACAIGS